MAHDGEEATPLTSPPNEPQWLDEVPPHLEPHLQTPPTQGLSQDQVLDRQARFGRNELVEKKRNKLLHFLSFCKQCFPFLSPACLLTVFQLRVLYRT